MEFTALDCSGRYLRRNQPPALQVEAARQFKQIVSSPKQLIRIMKLTPLILLSTCLQVAAAGRAQKVTISLRDVPVQKVFQEVILQVGISIVYDDAYFKDAKPVSIHVKDALPADVVRQCIAGLPLTLLLDQGSLFIRPLAPDSQSFPGYFLVSAPPVSGRVLGAQGIPLPGVNIQLKGTTRGTVTNEKGEFAIDASPNAVLIVSFIGYVTKEVRVVSGRDLSIQLEIETKSLDEVEVMVAYGVQKKGSITSAVSSVGGDEIKGSPVANLSNALGGRLSGVLSKQYGGQAGADGATISIRGIGTIGNSAPLVIVDGIPRNYTDLDPNSIESVTVLKDAAAVAPYGVSGANGVILITTRNGKTGTPSLEYRGYYGWQNPVKLAKTVNSYQYARMLNEAYLNDHPGDVDNVPFDEEALEGYRKVVEGAPDADPDRYFNSNNLHDVVRQNSPIMNHTLQISGGSERIRYIASLGYLKQESMLPNESVDKYNALVNLEADVTKTTKARLSVNSTRKTLSGPGMDVIAEFGIYQGAYLTAPIEPIYYSNGLWAAGFLGYNLVGKLYTSGRKTQTTNTTYTALSIEQQIPFVKGLSLKGVISYDPSSIYGRRWQTDPYYYLVDYNTSPYTFNKVESGIKPNYSESYSQAQALTTQGFINYNNRFGKHAITALFVAEARKVDYNSFSAGRRNYNIPIQTIDQGSSAQEDLSNSGSASNSSQVGFVSRISYSYASRYLVELSGRYDGHYYFAPDHRWGFFPAASVGWRLSEENFIKNNIPAIDDLKLRGSWGESGNLAGQPFQYLSTYGIYGEAYRIGGVLQQGLYELAPGNPEITWERQRQVDIGIDGVLWNGLLRFEIDYFQQRRNNMLLVPNNNVPAEYGISLSQVNAGIMENRGIEFTLGTSHTFSNGLRLNVDANFTQARNKTIQIFENLATFNDPNRRRTGRPYNARFGYVAIGYFQSQEEIEKSPEQKLGVYKVGDLKYKDLNGDGIVDGRDQTMIGNSGYPEVIFGLNPSASWKGFDVSLLFQGSTRHDVYAPGPGYAGYVTPGLSGGPYQIEGLDYWTPENRDARFPRLTSSPINNNAVSSWWMRDGTFVRLKNFEVGYTIPVSVIGRLGIQSMRIYSAGQNMLTWAKEIKNLDPESSGGSRYSFVNQKVFSVGLNVKF